MHDELAALQKEHDKWLKANKDKIGVETTLAAFVDKSFTNLSSIVVLAEAEGKRMLLDRRRSWRQGARRSRDGRTADQRPATRCM